MVKFLESLHFCGDSKYYVGFNITYVPPKKRFMRSPKSGEIVVVLFGLNVSMLHIHKDRNKEFIIPTDLNYGRELNELMMKISTEISNWISSDNDVNVTNTPKRSGVLKYYNNTEELEQYTRKQIIDLIEYCLDQNDDHTAGVLFDNWIGYRNASIN